MRLQTSRLVLEDVGERPNPGEFLCIFNSNPDFIEAAYQFTGKQKRSYELWEVDRFLLQETIRENSHCLAIRLRETGKLVGTAALVSPHPEVPSPWIGLLIIDGEQQGHGLGTEAARALEEHLTAEGWTDIRLTVLQALPEARCFWERLGYVVYEEHQDEKKRLCWQMRKTLHLTSGQHGKSG
jgi:RimJ/RimL family protein N-acetyltransferase